MDLATAKTTVFDLLAADDNGTPGDGLPDYVQRIYRGEPRVGQLTKPVSVTVATSSMTAYEIGVDVRIYVSPDVEVVTAQDWVDETVEAVERLLDDQEDSSLFTRGDWQIGYLADIDMIVASCTMVCSRTDF